MLASVTNKAKALGGLNSKFISYALKDLQGLCSKQLRTQLLPLLVPCSSWTLDSSLFSQMMGKREGLLGGLRKQPCLDVVHLFRPYPTGQKSNGYMCNCEGGRERWCSSVPRRKGR